MKKYSIGLSYEFRNTFEVEADSLEDAQDKVMAQLGEFELSAEGMDCRDNYQFFDCKELSNEKKNNNPQQKARSQVIATGNKWAIENWNSTHNENLKI